MIHDLFTYPHAAGAKEETTSREAAKAIERSGRAATLRERVLLCLQQGDMTADEVADRLLETAFSIRPRITELRQTGMIERTGERRITNGGRPGHVFRRVR